MKTTCETHLNNPLLPAKSIIFASPAQTILLVSFQTAMMAASGCKCKLDLGIHHFPAKALPETKPLDVRFQDDVLTIAHPVSKRQESGPVVDILTRVTEEVYFNEDSPKFQCLPPAILPNTKAAPGFPSGYKDKMETEAEQKDSVGTETSEDPTVKDKVKKKNLTEKDKQKDWFNLYEQRYAEEVVSQAYLHYFNKHPDLEGFLLHPYCSETYLEVLKRRARDQRETKAYEENYTHSSCLPLTDLELDICDALGLHIRDIKVESLETLVEELIEKSPTKERKKNVTAKVEKGRKMKLQDEDIMNQLLHMHFISEIEGKNFETDLVFTLKDSKSIVDVEIKSTPDTRDKSLKNTLQKAAVQLKVANITFSSSHQDILTEEWSFVRAIAIPNITNKRLQLKLQNQESICCEHCLEFVLDEADLKDVNGWMTRLLDRLYVNQKLGPTEDPLAYRKIFTRLVGFSSVTNSMRDSVSLSLSGTRALNEKAIVGGEKPKGISSELTLACEVLPKDIKNLQLKDLERGKHLSSLDVMCYWNPPQFSLLLKNPQRVLFDSDFGCGKTLLMKHFAVNHASTSNSDSDQPLRKVFYVSLASARGQAYDEQSWTRPAIIDVATEMDFSGTAVEVNKIVTLTNLIPGSCTSGGDKLFKQAPLAGNCKPATWLLKS